MPKRLFAPIATEEKLGRGWRRCGRQGWSERRLAGAGARMDEIDDVPAFPLVELGGKPRHSASRDSIADPPEKITVAVLENVCRREIRGSDRRAGRERAISPPGDAMAGCTMLGIDRAPMVDRRCREGDARAEEGGRISRDDHEAKGPPPDGQR